MYTALTFANGCPMSAAEVERAVNSAPSGRDYEQERRELLARAEAARNAAEDIDCDSAAAEMLRRTGAAAGEAMLRGERAAEGARAKIAEQQERFKAGMIVDGVSLDNETVEVQVSAHAPAANKYSMQMQRRRNLQEQEKLRR